MAIVGSKTHLKWGQYLVPDLLRWNHSTVSLAATGKPWGEGPRFTLAECDPPGDRVFWEPAGSLGSGFLWPQAADAPPTAGAGGGTRRRVAQAGGHPPATGPHQRVFVGIPLPHGKTIPVYLLFCWCVSLPSSPSVNPSEQSERPWAGVRDAGNAAAAASLQLLHQLED